METLTQLELKLGDMLTDALRRVPSVYCPIKEWRLCEYLQQSGWVRIESMFPGDGRHEGRIFMEKGPDYIALMDKTFSRWYKERNPDKND